MRHKRSKNTPEKMDKPKFAIGDTVIVDFLGSKYKVTLNELKPNPQHIERWVYKGITMDGFVISYIGINGSEKFANIIT